MNSDANECIKKFLTNNFNDIKETEIEIIDINKPNLYIDDIKHEHSISAEDKIILHKIREDAEWERIENLYYTLMHKASNYNYFKGDIMRYEDDCKKGDWVNPQFELLDRKLQELSKKYNLKSVKLDLCYIESISKLKKFSNLKIEWKNENIIKSKVYYFYVGFGLGFVNLVEESGKFYGKSIIKGKCNQIIFNDIVNPNLYNLYLQVKEEKNKINVNNNFEEINVNNNSEEIKKLLENTNL